jgi:O-acetyl-ADP-ribose deacetylase (regulator of RNase III)
MGKGVALAIKQRWPTAWRVDLNTVKGDKSKLGKISVGVDAEHTVLNLYTQYHYGKLHISLDMDVLRHCLQAVKRLYPGVDIAIPKIGAGLAKGDWTAIETLISEVWDDRGVYVYVL